jgi:hypothetical protein
MAPGSSGTGIYRVTNALVSVIIVNTVNYSPTHARRTTMAKYKHLGPVEFPRRVNQEQSEERPGYRFIT